MKWNCLCHRRPEIQLFHLIVTGQLTPSHLDRLFYCLAYIVLLSGDNLAATKQNSPFLIPYQWGIISAVNQVETHLSGDWKVETIWISSSPPKKSAVTSNYQTKERETNGNCNCEKETPCADLTFLFLSLAIFAQLICLSFIYHRASIRDLIQS